MKASRKSVRGNMMSGIILGIVLQLAFLAFRMDGAAAVAGAILFVVGLLWKFYPPRQPSPPPAPSDKDYWRYRNGVDARKTLARIDLMAWGGTMMLVEGIALVLYFLFGFHFPLAPGA